MKRASILSCSLVVSFLLAACGAGHPSIGDVRAELLSVVSDVPGATGHRYQVVDDRGYPMGPVKIIQGPSSDLYVAVYAWDDGPGPFTASVATSTNLLDWTWRADLGFDASQPTIAAAEDGGYVVAWEQGITDDIHVRLSYYRSWDDLLRGAATKTFDARRQLPGCAEGTPNLYAASSTHVEFGLHYYRACQADRQARGTTDWTTWHAAELPLLDRAVLLHGYRGSVGDRDTIRFKGYDFTFIEGQFAPESWDAWRIFVYDEETGAADRASYPAFAPEPPSEHVFIRTHHGSHSFSNISVSEVELGGRPAIVVGLFIQRGHPDEEGPLIYYRVLDDGAGSTTGAP